MNSLLLHSLTDRSILLNKYNSKHTVFPLIGSVLDGTQQGEIYANHNHENFFIVHKFGFADLIENGDQDFDHSLHDFLINGRFSSEKIRWYNVPEKWLEKLRNSNNTKIQIAERVQLIRDSFSPVDNQSKDNAIDITGISDLNFADVTDFNIYPEDRFWSSRQDFLQHSLGILIYKNGIAVSLCYACTVSNEIAEVDVITKEQFRGQGFGKLAVIAFINKCNEAGIKVHWDCYTNNQPSFSLAKSLGFHAYHVYTHAIISR